MNLIKKILLLLIIFIQIGFCQEKPKWIYNPNFDKKFIGGVGSSNSGNLYRDLQIAKILGRANLAENIKVEIESIFVKKNRKINYIVIQKSKELLKNSFVNDEWVSPKGELFLWIVIEK
jgi:hypothetical protein